jgi:uncharacterized protein
MKALRLLSILVLGWALAGLAYAQLVPVPPLTGHLIDQAGMLDAAQRARLEAVLTDYEAKTGSQIAVLLVKSTQPEQLEQYSIRVVDAWKLGRKGVDDGVLLLVARDNPKGFGGRMRIETGRGVQGVLTDAKSKQILQDVIAPHFRQNQFYDGLVAGVGSIATLLNAEKFPAPPEVPVNQRPNAGEQEDTGSTFWLSLVLLGAFFFARKFMTRGSRLANGNWGSGATGFILGSVLNNMSHSSGSGGFSSGGGFSDGGGFSGGGGGFDGGGASGDW